MTLKFGSLFSGIGGIDLGLERAGMRCSWQVEIDDYCRQVLAKHWPDVERFDDVRQCGKHNLAAVDVIVGGFPCQPFSVAGKQRGAADDRNLWPEMFRIVQELQPAWVVGENVPNIANLYLDQVLFDLEGAGYEAWPIDLPACAFDAWHIRQRTLILAHSESRGEGRLSIRPRGPYEAPPDPVGDGAFLPNADGQRQQEQCGAFPVQERHEGAECGRRWPAEPDVGRVVHGVPHRVDRLRALGNAVVPQVAEFIGRLIVEADHA